MSRFSKMKLLLVTRIFIVLLKGIFEEHAIVTTQYEKGPCRRRNNFRVSSKCKILRKSRNTCSFWQYGKIYEVVIWIPTFYILSSLVVRKRKKPLPKTLTFCANISIFQMFFQPWGFINGRLHHFMPTFHWHKPPSSFEPKYNEILMQPSSSTYPNLHFLHFKRKVY